MFLQMLLIVLIIVLVLYVIGNNNKRYWKKKGVTFHNKNKLLGPFWDFLLQKCTLYQAFGKLYTEYKDKPAVGIGSIFGPSLFMIDPKNIHTILQTDFNSFNERGMESFNDKLSDNITFMNGPRWKLIRQNMSPMFTATKLKNMFYIMNKSSEDFVEHLTNNPEKCEGDLLDTIVTFCNAAVCSTIFGISTQSIFDSPFLKVAETFSKPSILKDLKLSIMNMSPKLAKLLRLKVFHEHEDFFIDAITRCVKQRKQDNVKIHDFIDTCINIQNNGTMRDPTTGYEMEPTYEIMSAQAFFFFIAGVDPCAISIFTTLFLLGRHPEVLKKVQREIDNACENQIIYETISQMEYLDKVLSESMRMFPPISMLIRKCVKDTVLPVGNLKIDKDTKIYIPIYDLHHDPDLYPEPHVFDPERFTKERKPSDEIYIPFGRGNRMCLGTRYSRLQILTTLAHILRHFEVKSIQDSKEIKFKMDAVFIKPLNINIKLIPRAINSCCE